ncbi:MAG: nitrous oxide reductase family maturation protein NosD [Promethearchaeota archaeon]
MYKKIKNKKIRIIFGVILLITLNLASVPSFLTPINKEIKELKEIRSAGVYYDIEINDLPSSPTNWSWAATQPWFKGGSGTPVDPYRIEDETFMYSSGAGECLRIFHSNKHFIIRNCTFTNSFPSLAGLYFVNVTNGQFLENNVVFNGYGLVCDNVSNTIISNNDFSYYSDYGIWLIDNCDNNVITGNTVNGHGGDYGIALDLDADNNLIYNNIIKNHGVDNAYDDGFNNDWNNTGIGNYWDDYPGYDMDLNGIGDIPYSIPGSAGAFDYLPIWNIQTPIAIDDLPGSPTNWLWAQTQPWFGGGSGTSGDPYILENFNIDGGGTTNCITVLNSNKHFIIRDSHLYNSGGSPPASLVLWNVTNSQIIGNNVSSSTNMGILLFLCDYNVISGNTGNLNQIGLILYGSNHSTVTENTFNNNLMVGMIAYYSSHNDIIGNTINNNIANGTSVIESDNNIIFGNSIENNDIGVFLSSGSNNNLFYENYFRNSGTNHAFDNGVNNDWNNTLIGNYWDDYTGYDMDLDGIGDTPYDVPPPGGSQDYMPIWNLQGPIAIDDLPSSMNNWAWAVSQVWCSGSGTELDPYIIEDLIIDGKLADICIEISNSDAHFIIRGCSLNNTPSGATDAGIYLNNVTNGVIIDNTFYNHRNACIFGIMSHNNTISDNSFDFFQHGIYLYGSSNELLDNNIYGDLSGTGIVLEGSYYYNHITGNTIENCYQGILILSPNNNTISGNNAFGNTMNGIGFSDSDFNYISDNTFHDNGLHGILMIAGSNDNTIENTMVYDNFQNGIDLESCSNNIINDNIILDNINNGIDLDGTSNNNLIYGNFFSGNGIHAFDDGSNNDWNTTIIGNYWANWTSPDSEPDGIVDIPYTFIKGTANSIDYLPIAEDGPPSITINSPSTNDVFGTSAPGFSVTITDDFLDETWYTIDGGLHNFTFTGSTGTIDQSAWDTASDGAITLTFYASDHADNIGSATVNIERDTQAPNITITSPSTDDTFVGAPSFVVEITDDNLDSMWYSLDGGITTFTFDTNGTIDSSAWAALATGSVTITFYANDTAGNLTSESVNVIKVPPASGDMTIIIIIVVSAVTGAAVVTIIIILRKRKAGEE